MNRALASLIGTTLILLSGSASAALLGTSVTGTLEFNGGATNYFVSGNGFVPAGCQNSGINSPTVTIVNPTAEFCFDSAYNTDTANFTDTGLTITDLAAAYGTDSSYTMTFTFAPGLVTGVTASMNSYPTGAMVGFANDELTLNFAGFATTPGTTYSETFAITTTAATTVPEPSTISLLALSLGLGVVSARRRRVPRNG